MGQIGLGTLVFGQFLHFDDLQPFTCDKNLQPEAYDIKIGLTLVDF